MPFPGIVPPHLHMFKRLRLHHPEKCKLTQSEVQDRQETRKEAWHIHGAKAEEESCRKQDRLKRHPYDKQQSIGTKKRGTGSSSCRIYLPVARRQRPEFEEIEKNGIHIVSCGNQRVHELTHEPRPQRCRSPEWHAGRISDMTEIRTSEPSSSLKTWSSRTFQAVPYRNLGYATPYFFSQLPWR